MIRAILHLISDQPLAVELLEAPTASDMAVVCTNVRTVDGKRPVFIDYSSSTFVFPMAMVRFVEIPRAEDEAARVGPTTALADNEAEEDLEIDEDFLRRVREA